MTNLSEQPPSSLDPAQTRRRRPHRKSRNGCSMCKIRKVKCTMEKPACRSCVRFGALCSLGPGSGAVAASLRLGREPGDQDASATAPKPGPARRGRPRKDWSASSQTANDPTTTLGTAANTGSDSRRAGACCPLDTPDTELLLHYIASTSRTFSGPAPSTASDHDLSQTQTQTQTRDPMHRFWGHNVPQLALKHHFVMHLLLAVAGHHLAYQRRHQHRPINAPNTPADQTAPHRTLPPDANAQAQAQQYSALAAAHASQGLRGFNAALANPCPADAGALYVSALLVCYCTFAAGPTGPGDLLICNVNDAQSEGEATPRVQQHLQLPINGVRIIREIINPATLFTGLLEPLRPTGSRQATVSTCRRDGFPRVEWEEPLSKLRGFIVSHADADRHPDPDVPIYLRALESLADIYTATYGDRNGSYTGPETNAHVFGWLYRLPAEYLACLHRRRPAALLILAYYAVLFRTVEGVWFMEGWMGQVVRGVWGVLREIEGFRGLMEWPVGFLENI